MTRVDVIRAWKDEDYRLSLSAAEQAVLPENPAGIIDLSDTELAGVAGGYEDMLFEAASERMLTLGCCKGFTTDTCVCSYTCNCGNWTREVMVCGPGIAMY